MGSVDTHNLKRGGNLNSNQQQIIIPSLALTGLILYHHAIAAIDYADTRAVKIHCNSGEVFELDASDSMLCLQQLGLTRIESPEARHG